MKKKGLLTLSIGLGLTAACAFNSFARGWEFIDAVWKYRNEDGQFAVNEWKISGNGWFYIGGTGEIVCDAIVEDNYYVNASGEMVTSTYVQDKWSGEDNKWYFFGEDGQMIRNSWHWVDKDQDGTSECYYFGADGHVVANAVTPDNCQTNAEGAWIVDGVVQTKLWKAEFDEYWKARLQCLTEVRPWEKPLTYYNKNRQGVFFEMDLFYFEGAYKDEPEAMDDFTRSETEYWAEKAAPEIVSQYTEPGTVFKYYAQYCDGPEEIDYYLTCLKNALEEMGYNAHMTVRINTDTYTIVKTTINFLEKRQ